MSTLSITPVLLYQGERGHSNLDYSINLDVVPRKGNPEVAAAAQEIFLEAGIEAKKVLKQTMGVLLANLFTAWATRGNPFLAVPLRSSDYAPGSRLRLLWLKYRPTANAIGILQDLSYIERHRGIYSSVLRRRTRIRALPKLIAIFLRQKIKLDCLEFQPCAPVLLRGPKTSGTQKGKNISIRRGKNAQLARPIIENVERINAALGNACIELCIDEQRFIDNYIARPDNKRRLTPPNPLQNRLYRVFNISFQLGGRFYGHWVQGIPRALRSFIYINGKPTVELDFKAIHPSLLYAEHGLPLPREMYVPPHWPAEFRCIFKLLMLAAINANTPAEAIQGVRYSIHNNQNLVRAFPDCLRTAWISSALESLKQLHQPIADEFSTGAGLRLQRKDSDIAEHVMLALLDKGIISIPIHDSFIVAQTHEAALLEAMTKASQAIAGVPIPVERKGRVIATIT